jgi:outer membrane protein insertion porin family
MRPSAFVDVGSLFSLTRPDLIDIPATCVPKTTNTTGTQFTIPASTPTAACVDAQGNADYTRVPGYKEVFLGNSPKPRLSIGIGVNWTSPFGPLRLDLAKAILKQKGDETKLFSFNVGTAF